MRVMLHDEGGWAPGQGIPVSFEEVRHLHPADAWGDHGSGRLTRRRGWIAPRSCVYGRSPGRVLWRRWPLHGQEPRANRLVTSSLTRPEPRSSGSRERWPNRRSSWWCWRKKGLSLMPDKPVPSRVDAAVKQELLDLADYAAGQDWPAPKTCEVLGLSQQRQRRWRRRQEGGEALDDGRSGASINALMPCEAEAIVDAFETLPTRTSSTGLTWALTTGCSGYQPPWSAEG